MEIQLDSRLDSIGVRATVILDADEHVTIVSKNGRRRLRIDTTDEGTAVGLGVEDAEPRS